MSVENEVANLTTSVDNLTEAVNVKKQTLDATVADSEAARDQSQTARDTALTYRDQSLSHANDALAYSQDAASAVAYQDLASIAESKSESAVDVFVYDTSRDSDGGAWRKRTQHTSWYNEPLNTSTRGARREFPAVAVLVIENNSDGAGITIYDGDDPALPMWMVFTATSSDSHRDFLNGVGLKGSKRRVSALNGFIAVNSDYGSSYYSHIGGVDFVSDELFRWFSYYQTVAISPLAIEERNSSEVGFSPTNNAYGAQTAYFDWANRDATAGNGNSLSMSVLPKEEINPKTGLPYVTIGHAADDGVTIFRNALQNSLAQKFFNSSACNSVYLDGSLAYVAGVGPDAYNAVWRWDWKADTTQKYGGSGNDLLETYFGNDKRWRVLADKSTLFAGSFRNKALRLMKMDADNASKNLLCHVFSSYNTGWMNGDIKGAFLSDTDDTDLVESGELVTNGTFDTDTSGWTASTADVSGAVVGGQLEVTNNGAGWFYQEITTVVGQCYTVVLDFVAKQGGGRLRVGTSIGNSSFLEVSVAGNGQTFDFVATTTTTYISLGDRTGGTGVVNTYDNISVKLADNDRSVNNNGLIVNGTVTRSPVAPGADLVAYSGFSTSNYLEQPYNPDLDFGTGDFCVMGWVRNKNNNEAILQRGVSGSGFSNPNDLYITQNSDGNLSVRLGDENSISSTETINSGQWYYVTVLRKGLGAVELYINGKLSVTGSSNHDLTSAGGDHTLLLGGRHDQDVGTVGAPFGGSLSLFRISATAPTPEQIKKIYEDEKVLFQENAQATLYGSSDAVTALAHDEVTDLLHVGTSDGRSVFQGLRRVDNTADPVNTAISAHNGMIAEE